MGVRQPKIYSIKHQHQSLIQTEDWAILVFGVNKLRDSRARAYVHYNNIKNTNDPFIHTTYKTTSSIACTCNN